MAKFYSDIDILLKSNLTIEKSVLFCSNDSLSICKIHHGMMEMEGAHV